jgi:TRAP-type transport system small permease protein
MLPALEQAALAATRALSVVGLAALMGLAGMTLADGLMRWIANQPIEGVRDLGGLAIAVAIACCIPIVMSERRNITIRLAAEASPAFSRVLDAVAAVVVCMVLAAMAWQLGLYAAKMARAQETTFVLQIPVAPFWLGVDVILWCAVLVQAIGALRDIARVMTR